mmetsp:Transcript_30456/g.72120  ORF Transcript_30456/g.72120 Transcript_30456/m.72120 type:complete len:204 (+) Transcript_30456:1670-2281(+)
MQFWRYQLGASLARERPLSEVRLVWLRIADAKTSVSRVESDCKCVQHRALHVASALSVSALNLRKQGCDPALSARSFNPFKSPCGSTPTPCSITVTVCISCVSREPSLSSSSAFRSMLISSRLLRVGMISPSFSRPATPIAFLERSSVTSAECELRASRNTTAPSVLMRLLARLRCFRLGMRCTAAASSLQPSSSTAFPIRSK